MGSLVMFPVIARATELTEALWDTARAAAPHPLCGKNRGDPTRKKTKFGEFPDYQYSDRYNWDEISRWSAFKMVCVQVPVTEGRSCALPASPSLCARPF